MEKKKPNQRWRLMADVRLQGAICLRVAFYWILCQVAIIGTIAGFEFLTGAGANGTVSAAKFFVPALIVSFLFLPFAILDMLQFTNRFAGPMVSLRRKLSRFGKTGFLDETQIRKGDFYSDICDSLNEIHERTKLAERENFVLDEEPSEKEYLSEESCV